MSCNAAITSFSHEDWRATKTTSLMATTIGLTKQAPRSRACNSAATPFSRGCSTKGRALAGANGEYRYNCPLDQRFTEFTGIDAEALKQQLAAGKGDGEILDWINISAKFKRTAPRSKRGPHGRRSARRQSDSRGYFNELHTAVAPKRTDIASWFDLLDVDDFGSFGGKI